MLFVICDTTTYPESARRTRAPPRESGADLRGSVDAIVVCHVSEIPQVQVQVQVQDKHKCKHKCKHKYNRSTSQVKFKDKLS